MNSKKWVIMSLLLSLVVLVIGALPTIIIDPFFHYHKPIDGLSYKIDYQRYQNDGIVKHFDYDAIITGTSMTENFKTTEMDAIFGTNSVKVSYSGGSYKEIGDNLRNAFHANPDIRYVIRGIDCNRIIEHKDTMSYDGTTYPTYLYDWNPLNDAAYFWNKQVLFDNTSHVLARTNAGIPTTTFDEYRYWSHEYEYGKDAFIHLYIRPGKHTDIYQVNEEELVRMQESIEQNFIELVEQNPDTQFYYFFTPYSIIWWDNISQLGETDRYITLMKEASRMMVAYENVHLFSFFDMEDLICDLDDYKDTLHYSGEINSQMLKWMKNDEHRLTAENYEEHWDAMLEYYSNYDYESLFE